MTHSGLSFFGCRTVCASALYSIKLYVNVGILFSLLLLFSYMNNWCASISFVSLVF